jgi:GPH family glycoside/pentoside/hexuronide:cation symporter
MSDRSQKLSFVEKAGYSAGDAAANFVFMTMVLFQLNFYTDVFGLSASAAAAILLWPRLWDAVFDPIMGVLADRTNTRWGKFRPWVLWTSIPWAIVMVLAYSTPHGWSMGMMIAYAGITNTVLMTLYSMNNMPYSALGGVMTGDLNERTKLNSFRFISVNIAQFIVGGLTLPLVAKFAQGHDRQHGWQVTMTIWAVLCLVLFLVTFLTTKERIKPVTEVRSSPKQDFTDLLKNRPWIALVAYTVFNFAMLSYRGGAHYNYYHHYADKSAMFDFVTKLGLTTPDIAKGPGLLEFLGYIVHGTRETAAASNAADVFNSIINMAGTATTIVFIMLSAGMSKKYGKKAVIGWGFALAALNAFALYLLPPTATTGMLLLAVTGSIVYAPTIAVAWAMYADAADYSEWQTGRRFTGMVFATIGFSLKSGLALGSAAFLWIMAGCFDYDTQLPAAANAIAGYHTSSSLVVGLLFLGGALSIATCTLNKSLTLQMADELAARRAKAGAT